MTIVAIILTLLPFVLLVFARNTLQALVHVIIALLSLHVGIALLTQLFSIFSYSVVLILHIVGTIGILYYLHKKECQYQKLSLKKFLELGVVLIGLVIITVNFSSMHFSYSGFVQTSNGNEIYVQDDTYTYPLFSDEWIAVYVAEKTIEDRSLPLRKFFFNGPNFNFLFVFHALIAELTLFFGLTIVTQYVLLAIIFGVLTCAMVYLTMRSFGIQIWISLLVMLSIPYITSGSNLPFLWYLLPWNIGILYLLAAYVYITHQKQKMALLCLFFSMLLYPPMLLFAIPVLVWYSWRFFKRNTRKSLLVAGAIVFILLLGALILSVRAGISLGRFIEIATAIIIRPLRSGYGQPPSLAIWNIIPWPLLIACVVALYVDAKKYMYITIPSAIGLVMWVLYALGIPTVIADYHRVTAITTIHLVLFAAVGLSYLFQVVAKKYPQLTNQKIIFTLLAMLLLVFAYGSFFYSERGSWRKLETRIWNTTTQTYDIYPPVSPVNRYLQQEDIELFAPYSQKVFLAVPWKGLTLAAVTDNVPLRTKAATFTVSRLAVNTFVGASCQDKHKLAKKYKLDLVYIPVTVECDGFNFIAESSEGHRLYEVQR